MIERLREIIASGVVGDTEVAKILFPDLDYRVAGRKRVARLRKKFNVEYLVSNEVKPKKPENTSSIKSIPDQEPVEKFVLSAWNQETGIMMDIDQYCEKYNLPRSDIKDYKLITHTGTPYYNIHFKDNILDESSILNVEFIDDIVNKYLTNTKRVKYKQNPWKSNVTIRAIYSDTHVGMCPNPDGTSMYGGKWDKEELENRLDIFVSDIISKAMIVNSSELVIDDLGDFMDGWEGYTVRRDHEIPQNMTTPEAFDIGVKFKVNMVDMLVDSGMFSSIKLNNICNDNHAGSFGYVVNSAVKSILEAKYKNFVSVNNVQKFMDHHIIGSHCFIICHGKDDKHMKFGFKTNPDDKISSKIDQYIKSNNLYQQAKYFEFSKGDSHQMVFDFATSDDFRYMNYPAFSPSSDWVQTNFKRGKSGFVIQIITKDIEEIDFCYKFFNWVK